MIVRIIGQGQWTVEPEALADLNDLDRAVEQAVADDDQAALSHALQALLGEVQSRGEIVPDEVLADSDLILPDVDATVAQVREFLDEAGSTEGLIPDGSIPEGRTGTQ